MPIETSRYSMEFSICTPYGISPLSFAGLTRLQLDEVGRERQVQQQGRQRAEAPAERSVEIAQAMVPLAGALARGGG